MRAKNITLPIFAIALIGLLVGIFSPEPHPKLFEHSDKYEHLLAFMVVSLSGAFYFDGLKGRFFYWSAWLLMAYLLEYGQGLYLPKRTFDLYDVYANAAGVVVALFLWSVVVLYTKKYSEAG